MTFTIVPVSILYISFRSFIPNMIYFNVDVRIMELWLWNRIVKRIGCFMRLGRFFILTPSCQYLSLVKICVCVHSHLVTPHSDISGFAIFKHWKPDGSYEDWNGNIFRQYSKIGTTAIVSILLCWQKIFVSHMHPFLFIIPNNIFNVHLRIMGMWLWNENVNDLNIH